MKNRIMTGILFLAALASCSPKDGGTTSSFLPDDLTAFVDPWIGSGEHGHVFVGANVPFGMVQLGPTSVLEGWDWVSGYHYSDSTILGFSHTHFSGTGIGDLLDVTLMPVVGDVTYARGTVDDPYSGLWSYSRRSTEVVEPGYYSAHLLRYGVDVELTATDRVGLHKYTFPTTDMPTSVVIDLENGGNWDKPTESFVRKVSDDKLEGYRLSTGWAKDQRVYFAIQFSTPLTSVEVIADGKGMPDEHKGKAVYARADVSVKNGEPVYVRVALSPTSMEDAWANMSAELTDFDFDRVHREAKDKWSNELDRIRIATADTAILRTFYTAMYHAMMAPSTYANADHSYLGSDFRKHADPGYTTRTTFSLWDTYRAAHPLYTLIHTDMMPDVVGSFQAIYDEQGKLPVWHFYANETNTMVGNPGIPVLADAVLKGFVSDPERAYQAMKASAMLDERGQAARKEYGYIPYDTMFESVAYDMEYAIADWAVAQVAKKLGHEEDYAYFLGRSKSYQHLFDPVTGFMRGKSKTGQWNEPFDPYHSNHRGDDYCEGNAWQYTFLVPHDVHGLVKCFGSLESFLYKLDSLFVVSSEVSGDIASPDISGLIGQYAHGNEPSHHILYMYSALGHQSKAAPLIRRVLSEMYGDTPAGISGNEDVGQMSAWYILSALGIYQMEPAGGRYYFGTPIVDAADLRVRDGVFSIRVHDNSADNIYIQRITLNGAEYTERYLEYEDIAKGGTVEIWMGATPRDF